MTLGDIGSIANLFAAIGVLVTLVYLSRQVRQGNLLARAQARQRMVEQTCDFLLAAMRQREWEWLQFKDGVIKRDVYAAYHEVIALHLGIPRTSRWWQTVGRIRFDSGFVADVDSFLAGRPTTDYFTKIGCFDRETSPAGVP